MQNRNLCVNFFLCEMYVVLDIILGSFPEVQ